MKTIIGKSTAKAAALLAAGELVAIPTETVYGLAANIFNKKAVGKIYQVKRRPRFNPLIVHVAGIQAAKELVSTFPPQAELLAKKFWPGPLTIVLPKNKKVGDWVTGGQSTVAIRVPAQPLALRLLRSLDFPLAAPSANPFTYISPVKPRQVKKMLDGRIGYILDGGKCSRGIESTIVSIHHGKVTLLRQGAVTEKELEAVLKIPLVRSAGKGPAHPGMFKRHYSPHTPLIFTDDILRVVEKEYSGKKTAVLLFRKRLHLPASVKQVVLSTAGNMEEAAANLYDSLHQLDNKGYDLLICEKLPERKLGKAINERLAKAASR